MSAAVVQDFDVVQARAEEAAALLRALSHPGRLQVLCELASGECRAGDLVAAAGLSQSALSQHLARLRTEGLVETRREGNAVFYRLRDPHVAAILASLRALYCGDAP